MPLRSQLLVQSRDQASLDIARDLLGLHSFVNLNGLLGGVYDHPAIWAFADVLMQLSLQTLVTAIVQVISELSQEFFTCKQIRRPLSA